MSAFPVSSRRAAGKMMLGCVPVAALLFGAASAAHAGATLDAVRQRGEVVCGVNTGLAGFSRPDASGEWQGIDVSVCRAVAAAVFGDGSKISFVPLNAQQRFPALQSGEVDILSRNTTWTLSRDTSLGLNFGPTVYYDGAGLMVAKGMGVSSVRQLDGATICVQQGTTTELNLADYFNQHGISYKPIVFQEQIETEGAFFSGRCDAFTTDVSGLASVRATRAPNPDDYVILPEIISKEPLGPAVRHGDDEWFDIVKWTVFALISAEELGITSTNVDSMKGSANPSVQRLLGVKPGMGQALGLGESWAADAIRSVGNYGEIFETNIGSRTPLRLERGLNALWTNGGLMYSPPVR